MGVNIIKERVHYSALTKIVRENFGHAEFAMTKNVGTTQLTHK